MAPPTDNPPPTLTSKLTVNILSIVVAPSTSKVPPRSVLESTFNVLWIVVAPPMHEPPPTITLSLAGLYLIPLSTLTVSIPVDTEFSTKGMKNS